MGATRQLLDSLFILVLQDWIVGPGDVLLRARPERLNDQVSQKKKGPCVSESYPGLSFAPRRHRGPSFNNEGALFFPLRSDMVVTGGGS